MLILFGSVVALIFGKQILVPFMFAVLIYFLIRSIHRLIDRNAFIKQHIPSWIKNIISAVLIFSLLGFITELLIINSNHLLNSLTNYQGNLEKILSQFNEQFGVDLQKTATDKLYSIDFATFANPLFNSLTSFLGNMLMIFFYVIFLFIEESNFKTKLQLIFHGQNLEKTVELLKNIEKSITHYIGLKTLVSFISGVCCYILCLSFGIDSPLLWAFLIFIMNFIPVIGALLGVFLPFSFSLMQFGEFFTPLVFLLILGSIQTFISNFLEPKLMGDSLNISPLVAILSLVIWGAMWGITGMIVSVPITVILIIILAQIPKTKSIAILLSHHGKI